MKKISLFFLIGAFLSAAFLFQYCEKNKEEISSDDTSIVQDDALSSEIYENVFNEAELILHNQLTSLKTQLEDTCKTVSMQKIDSVARKITIHYHGECEDIHGRIRKGKIIINTSGRYRKKGFIRTIAFENYWVNDFRIEGTKTVTNQGTNNNGYMYYSVTLKNGAITTPANKKITNEYQRTREWTKGYKTPFNIWD